MKCLVKTKDAAAIPKHAVLKDGRLTFPIFKNWTTITCFSQEVDYEMYDYKFLTGLQFEKACFMAKYFQDGFEKKALAKKDGKPAMAQAHKIIINSGYGFWGLKTRDRDGVEICSPDSNKYLEYLNSERLINFREHDDGTLFCRVLKNLKVTDFNVGVASAIASYARLKLHSLLTAIRSVGGDIYYCDTDSVICNINLSDHPEIQKEFQWDGDGSELGSLKNECDDVVEKQLKTLYLGDKAKQKAAMHEMTKAENGNLHFDRGIIAGCKQYGLTKTVQFEGVSHELPVLKCKGYSQKDGNLTYDDFVTLNSGKSIEQTQTQFRCPKSNYVSETDAFTITSKEVPKRFRKVYTKGCVQKSTGVVTPHEV